MGGLDPPTSYKEQEKNETNEQKDYPAGAGPVLCGSADAGGMWQLVRNNAAQVEECRAFALWTIDKKAMDEQIAFNLQNIIDNNKTLSQAARAIYIDLINDIRVNGFNNLRKTLID